ncbi:hypothetical protein [Azohydromonas aeria]|uniref:hypothetical protein n=1 Tax=Azohydromonas aeria TaxID=2590212 RepID=UPI0012F9FC19|nr:hypothetical protein [Azohydromonas aeria]
MTMLKIWRCTVVKEATRASPAWLQHLKLSCIDADQRSRAADSMAASTATATLSAGAALDDTNEQGRHVRHAMPGCSRSLV